MQRATAQGHIVAQLWPSCSKSQLRICAVSPASTHRLQRAVQRLRIAALRSQQYDESPSSTTYYKRPSSNTVRSSIQAVSFNQQLLVVLAVPLVALGIPVALDHPLVCIVLPLVIYYTPGLRAIAAPACTALLQLILSGLRPSGSPRSEAFPWQQTNSTAWSSPPIDVDYRTLPGDTQEESNSRINQTDSSSRQQRWQPGPGIDTESQQPNKEPLRQRVAVQQNPPRSTSMSRQRKKVAIRPAGEPSLNSSQRIVRQAAPGQVGVNLNRSYTAEPRSNVVRALLVVFPFLKDWGGFL